MKLYLVPTPVGNLGDMTYRAVEVLQSVSLILAEDTRTSRTVLAHYNIATPMQAYHIYNEHQVLHHLIERLKGGQELALITDAGTPCISDPGYLLVRECVREGIEVECLPGATAFVPAMVQSGIPCSSFTFIGFLPHKKGRQSALQALAQEPHALILYESPYRLLKLLKELQEVLGAEREAAVCREISKLHAETMRGALSYLYEYYTAHEPKGEIVVVVSGKNNNKTFKDEPSVAEAAR